MDIIDQLRPEESYEGLPEGSKFTKLKFPEVSGLAGETALMTRVEVLKTIAKNSSVNDN